MEEPPCRTGFGKAAVDSKGEDCRSQRINGRIPGQDEPQTQAVISAQAMLFGILQVKDSAALVPRARSPFGESVDSRIPAAMGWGIPANSVHDNAKERDGSTIFGNTIAKRFMSYNKMPQLPQSRAVCFCECFQPGAAVMDQMDGSRSIFHPISPNNICRMKMHSRPSCGMPAPKKRGCRP